MRIHIVSKFEEDWISLYRSPETSLNNAYLPARPTAHPADRAPAMCDKILRLYKFGTGE